MAEDDFFFREVEEELRRERLSRAWDKYGWLVIGTAVAIVVSVAGYKYWNWYQARQAETFGDRFMAAIDLEEEGKKNEALKSFSQIAAQGPSGYAMLAKLREAALKAAQGKTAQAIVEYERLADGEARDPHFRAFSRIQAAMLRVDEAPLDEMKKRLGKLADGKSSWRHSAIELLALSAWRNGERKQAETYYNRIVADRTAPAGIRRRAEMMLSLSLEEAAAAKGPAGGDAAAKPAGPSSGGKQPARPEAGKKPAQ